MTQLVSDAQMAYLRRIGDLGLLTDVDIRVRTTSTDTYGGDPTASWPSTGTIVSGWVMQTNKPPIDDRDGVSTTYGVYRLNLPATVTNISVGDRVSIGGLLYTVNNTNTNDTYRVYTTCLIKRIEDRANPL
jgi:hypothetical protein